MKIVLVVSRLHGCQNRLTSPFTSLFLILDPFAIDFPLRPTLDFFLSSFGKFNNFFPSLPALFFFLLLHVRLDGEVLRQSLGFSYSSQPTAVQIATRPVVFTLISLSFR